MTSRHIAVLLTAALAIGASGATAVGAPPTASAASYTIRTSGFSVSRIGAFRPRGDGTIAAARRVFGAPSSKRLTSDNDCQVEWRRLGLRISFSNFGVNPGQTTCSESVGLGQWFTARGRRFRTSRGLRPLARSSAVLQHHPGADFRRGSWWLVTAVSPYGEGGESPVIRAIVGGGRVRALAGYIGAAGE